MAYHRRIPRVDVDDSDDAADDPRCGELYELQTRAKLASDVEGACFGRGDAHCGPSPQVLTRNPKP